MLAVVLLVLRSKISKVASECTVKVVHVDGAASANVDYVGENQVVRASLYFMC